jgi:hypothetical protein
LPAKPELPAHVLFRKDWSLMLWKPHGVLDEVIVKEIVAFIDSPSSDVEKGNGGALLSLAQSNRDRTLD